MASPDDSNLRETLVEVFGKVDFDISNVSQRRAGNITISVCDIRYTEVAVRAEPTRARRVVEQTLVVLGAEQLNLPEFAATPHRAGLLRSLLSALVGDLGNIKFEDDPQFTDAYHLHGWKETPVRLLFTPQVRSFLVAHPDLAVRGKGQRVVVFEPNRVIRHDQATPFVQTALELLERLQAGGQALSDVPQLEVETQGKDLVATANRMGGLAGAMFARQLQKYSVTHRELDEFLRQVPPRKVPAGISQQVVGDNLMLIPVGMLFIVAGLTVGIGTTLAGIAPNIFFTLGFLLMMPLIGALLAGITGWYRVRKSRVLQEGRLFSGIITDVSQSDLSVNQQVQHRVRISFPNDAEESARRSVTCAAYSLGAEQAQQLFASQQPVRLLVDPQDQDHVVCLDLIALFD